MAELFIAEFKSVKKDGGVLLVGLDGLTDFNISLIGKFFGEGRYLDLVDFA